MMFVNKTILDREGIPLPDPDWTWEDFLEICGKVTHSTDGTGVVNQYGVSGYSWVDAFSTNGVRLFDEEGKSCDFTIPQIGEAISFLERLQAGNSGYNVSGRDFSDGNVAFQPMYYASYRDFVKNPLRESLYEDFEMTFLTMPAGSEGDNTSILDTLCVGMYSKSRHKKEAWDFIKMLTTDETIQSEIFKYSEGLSPCRDITERELKKELEDSAPGSQNINMDVVRHAMDTAVPKYAFYGQDEAESAVEYAVNEILSGEGNIRMEQVIQDRKIKGILSGE
jgi:multiple sugar transport system substrate-binding protein